MNTSPASSLTHRTAVRIVSGVLVVAAIAAGIAFGALLNRDPASATTTPTPSGTCILACAGQTAEGTGSIGGAPSLDVAGSHGSGSLGVAPQG
jgi:hypothetical protein